MLVRARDPRARNSEPARLPSFLCSLFACMACEGNERGRVPAVVGEAWSTPSLDMVLLNFAELMTQRIKEEVFNEVQKQMNSVTANEDLLARVAIIERVTQDMEGDIRTAFLRVESLQQKLNLVGATLVENTETPGEVQTSLKSSVSPKEPPPEKPVLLPEPHGASVFFPSTTSPKPSRRTLANDSQGTSSRTATPTQKAPSLQLDVQAQMQATPPHKAPPVQFDVQAQRVSQCATQALTIADPRSCDVRPVKAPPPCVGVVSAAWGTPLPIKAPPAQLSTKRQQYLVPAPGDCVGDLG